jgi:hypothetical protein
VNKILIVVLIGVIPFAVILGILMFADKHEQIPFSKESCESFNGGWIDEELACYAIEPEDCWKMGGQYETIANFYFSFTKKCTLDDY